LEGHLAVQGFDALEEAIDPLRSSNRRSHQYFAMALGNEDGERDLFIAPETAATSLYPHSQSRYDVDARVMRTASERRVPIRRLDTLLAEGIVYPTDHIKIDCEGAEPEILRGGRALLRSGVVSLEIESGLRASAELPMTHLGAVIEELTPLGFEIYDIVFDRVPRATFARRAKARGVRWPRNKARPGTLDLFLYRNAPPLDSDDLLRRVMILELYGLCDTAYDVLVDGAAVLPSAFPLEAASDRLIAWHVPRLRGTWRLRRIADRISHHLQHRKER
jgi:FkbM family methyltransferase